MDLSKLSLDEKTELAISTTDEKIMLELAKDKKDFIRQYLSENPNITEKVMIILAKDSFFGIRYELAENPNITETVMLLLAKDKDVSVRDLLVRNPNITESVMLFLAKDKEMSIRRLLGENPNITEKVMLILARDIEVSVRKDLCRNPVLSDKAVLILAVDENEEVRNVLFSRKNLPPNLYKALSDKSAKEQNLVENSHDFKDKNVTYHDYARSELFTESQLVIRLEDFAVKNKLSSKASVELWDELVLLSVQTYHPTTSYTLGWARVENLTAKDGKRLWVIIEIQSDLEPNMKQLYKQLKLVENKTARVLKLALGELSSIMHEMKLSPEVEKEIMKVETAGDRRKALLQIQKRHNLTSQQMGSLYGYFFKKQDKPVVDKSVLNTPVRNFKPELTVNPKIVSIYNRLVEQHGKADVHQAIREIQKFTENLYSEIYDLVLEKARENKIYDVYIVSPEVLDILSGLKVSEQRKAIEIYKKLPPTKGFIHHVPLNELIEDLELELQPKHDKEGEFIPMGHLTVIKHDPSAKKAYRIQKLANLI